MDKPELKNFTKPESIKDYPVGPSFSGGHLVSVNSGWRTFKPVVALDTCTGCYRCYLVCPDGVIVKTETGKVAVDYDFCKGCGVCAHECPFDAIEMVKEDLQK